MIRSRVGAMPIEGLTKNTRYRQEECTVIGMVVEVKTTTNGHRIAEIEDSGGTISGALPEGSAGFCRCRADHP